MSMRMTSQHDITFSLRFPWLSFVPPLPRIVPSPGVPVPAAAACEHHPETQQVLGDGAEQRGRHPETPQPSTPLPPASQPRSHLPPVPGPGSPGSHSPDAVSALLVEVTSARKGCRMSPKFSKAPDPPPRLLRFSKCRRRLQFGKAHA